MHEVFCEFPDQLIANATVPVFLIIDNHSAHTSEKFREFVSSAKRKLRFFNLPPYTPELSPDELVWTYLKNHNMGRISHYHAIASRAHGQSKRILSSFHHQIHQNVR